MGIAVEGIGLAGLGVPVVREVCALTVGFVQMMELAWTEVKSVNFY